MNHGDKVSINANIQKSSALYDVLDRVAKILEQEQIQWAVGGSCLLARVGIVDTPRDIDILIFEEQATQTRQILSQVGEHQVLPSKAPFLTKHFYQIVINDIEIDVMGGLSIQHDQGIFVYPFDSSSIAFTQNIDGKKIPYTFLEDWYVLYALMPDRDHRVKAIEEYWQEHKIKHPARLTQLLSFELPEQVVMKVKGVINKYT